VRIPRDDHPVVSRSALDADVFVPYVAENESGVSVERVAPPAAAVRQIAEDRAR
jgi:hypothetical protein